ncbi:MAG: hypothetical protein JWM16_234 [Verrucomicrobiales bacterium]|nr:hypothetical protein [Verrucomicrobiales bacterium]
MPRVFENDLVDPAWWNVKGTSQVVLGKLQRIHKFFPQDFAWVDGDKLFAFHLVVVNYFNTSPS